MPAIQPRKLSPLGAKPSFGFAGGSPSKPALDVFPHQPLRRNPFFSSLEPEPRRAKGRAAAGGLTRPWRTARSARTTRREATRPLSARTRRGPRFRGTLPVSRRYRNWGTVSSRVLAPMPVASGNGANIESTIFLAHGESHQQRAALRIAPDGAEPRLALVWIPCDDCPRVVDQGFDFMQRNATRALFPIAVIPIELANRTCSCVHKKGHWVNADRGAGSRQAAAITATSPACAPGDRRAGRRPRCAEARRGPQARSGARNA